MPGEGAPPRRRGRRPAGPSPIRQAVDADIARVFEELPPKSLALPGSVVPLPLPAPPADDEIDDEPGRALPARSPAVDLAPVLEAWVTPLVGEVARMRVELAELRAREQVRSQAPRAELVKLLAGILVCFALVAAALVVVLKA